MDCCKDKKNIEICKAYDPRPRNRDGSVSWYLYRWDDGKDGSRTLRRCRLCGRLYLVQAYHLNKFSCRRNSLFEDWYLVTSSAQADHWNKSYTGIQLEHRERPTFQLVLEEEKE